MEKIFEARTEQEAIELAVKEFGVSSEHIDVEVVHRNKSGIFGLQSKIVIRASVAGLPHPDDDRDETDGQSDTDEIQLEYESEDEQEEDSFELTDAMKTEIDSFIRRIAQPMGVEIQEIRMENSSPYVEVILDDAEDQNLLIGKFGKNIEALQTLVNAMLQNKIRDIPGWVIVDVENYRKKRTAWLRDIAIRRAKQVLKSGKSYLMDDFSPYDRRQIHNALHNIKGVKTESEGNGYFKRVRIFAS